MTRAVFLDRDGTLIEEAGYLDRIDRMTFFPYSLDAIRLLNRAGFHVIVVTNQAGVAHGYFGEEFVRKAHAHLSGKIREAGGEVDAFYYCPHHANAALEEYRRACECRKPQPGMFLTAAREHDVDLSASFAIGDRLNDVQAAHAAGIRPVMVKTGYGRTELERGNPGVAPAHVADTLIEATTWILQQRVS